MPARSFIVQLQPGIGQAVLPDHRKMVPGIQYVVDAETFSKISVGARQSVIQVVSVNTDATTSTGGYVPAQTSTGVNAQLSLQSILTTVNATTTSYSLAGFAGQGYDAGGETGTNTGVGLSGVNGNAANQTLTGPAGERYMYVYNGTSITIPANAPVVWFDENNRYISLGSAATLLVKVDGQGTPYIASTNTTLSGLTWNGAGNVTTVGTKQGNFAGITLVAIPAGYFGWILIEGIAPSVAVASGTTIGATVGVNSSTNLAGVPANTTTSISAAGVVTGSALANNIIGTVQSTPAAASNPVVVGTGTNGIASISGYGSTISGYIITLNSGNVFPTGTTIAISGTGTAAFNQSYLVTSGILGVSTLLASGVSNNTTSGTVTLSGNTTISGNGAFYYAQVEVRRADKVKKPYVRVYNKN